MTQYIKESDYLHIHKGNEINMDTKTFCKIYLSDCKHGATSFKNRLIATCPKCIKVAEKTEILLGV